MDGLPVTEIAKQLGIPASSNHRVLASLKGKARPESGSMRDGTRGDPECREQRLWRAGSVHGTVGAGSSRLRSGSRTGF